MCAAWSDEWNADPKILQFQPVVIESYPMTLARASFLPIVRSVSRYTLSSLSIPLFVDLSTPRSTISPIFYNLSSAFRLLSTSIDLTLNPCFSSHPSHLPLRATGHHPRLGPSRHLLPVRSPKRPSRRPKLWLDPHRILEMRARWDRRILSELPVYGEYRCCLE